MNISTHLPLKRHGSGHDVLLDHLTVLIFFHFDFCVFHSVIRRLMKLLYAFLKFFMINIIVVLRNMPLMKSPSITDI